MSQEKFYTFCFQLPLVYKYPTWPYCVSINHKSKIQITTRLDLYILSFKTFFYVTHSSVRLKYCTVVNSTENATILLKYFVHHNRQCYRPYTGFLLYIELLRSKETHQFQLLDTLICAKVQKLQYYILNNFKKKGHTLIISGVNCRSSPPVCCFLLLLFSPHCFCCFVEMPYANERT